MKWTFEAVRYIGNKKEAERVIKRYRGKGYAQAVSVKRAKQFGIAFKKDTGKDQFDFATALLLSDKIKTVNSVYLERLKGGKVVFVKFKGGLVERSRLIESEDAVRELEVLHTEKKEPKYVYAHGDLELNEPVEWLREPFTEVLQTSTECCFVTSSQILKPEKSKTRALATLMVASLIGVALTYYAWPEETKQRIENFTDVNAPYVNAIQKESRDFHTRMLQMYAFHSLFDSERNGSLHGWVIKNVKMAKSSTSVKLIPRTESSRTNRGNDVKVNPTAGGVQRFIESERFRAIVGKANFNLTTQSIEILAINQPVRFDAYSGKYRVRKMYNRLSDTVNNSMPNSNLVFYADYPNSLFVKSQTSLETTGGYVENLIGFGGMIKGLPISFGTASNDDIIGSYRITESGQITGSFAITLIGTKHAN